MSKKCTQPVETYARVCGFFRPVQAWNSAKQEEFKDRVNYALKEGEGHGKAD